MLYIAGDISELYTKPQHYDVMAYRSTH